MGGNSAREVVMDRTGELLKKKAKVPLGKESATQIELTANPL